MSRFIHILACTFAGLLLAANFTSCTTSDSSADATATADTRADSAAGVRPNVIFVMTDDQGYGDLACLGNPILKTPHLDDLYGRSVRLTNYHVSPTCSPTRGALMSGRNTHAAGVWHTIMGRSIMRPEEVTIAETFQANGYATGHFGKWHLGDNYPCRPQDQGFDTAVMHGGGGVVQTPDYFGNDYFDDTYFHNGKPVKHEGFCTDVFFDEAMKFITRSKDAGKPFFCYLPTNAAHGPFWAPEAYETMYRDNPDAPNVGFYGMITNIDDNMGRLVKFLEEEGLAENTILIFTTDNGSAVGERDGKGYNAGMRGHKGSNYDGGHRVPFFIRWPAGKLGGGRDIETLCAHIDVLPTLMELCGLDRPAGPELHGRSLVPLLHNKATDWPDRVIVVDSQRREFMVKGRNFAVMTQQWRYCTGGELYDIRADPGQRNNIAGRHPEVVQRLQAEYEKYWQMLEPLNDTYVRLVLGHESDNPARLTGHDWHTNNQGVPWNQSHIRNANRANGFWTVEISQAGKYRIELRRWPKEVGLAIDAPLPEDPWVTDNRMKTPGKAIHPVKARLKLGDVDQTIDISPGDLGATFEVELEAGPAELWTWLIEADGAERGAYYVYAERL